MQQVSRTAREGCPCLVVVFEEVVQEVHAFRGDQVGILRVGELVPGAAGMAPHQTLQLGVQLYPILAQVVVQLISAQHLGNLDKLVVVVVTVEEGLLPKHHTYSSTPLPASNSQAAA